MAHFFACGSWYARGSRVWWRPRRGVSAVGFGCTTYFTISQVEHFRNPSGRVPTLSPSPARRQPKRAAVNPPDLFLAPQLQAPVADRPRVRPDIPLWMRPLVVAALPSQDGRPKWGGQSVKLTYNFDFFFPAFFFGLPSFSVPTGTSQSCSLHFGQRTGLPATRLTHACPQRRQSQIMWRGIGIGVLLSQS